MQGLVSPEVVSTAGGLVTLALGVLTVACYNRLVRRSNLLLEAWSGVEVQLKRRHDLIPELVRIVQGYADFERSLLEEITRLRSQAVKSGEQALRQDVENALTVRLTNLLALAERHPELQASRSFLGFQERLARIEEQIQMARRYHNGTVKDYNISVSSFPSNLVARLFGFSEAGFFQVESAMERRAPNLEMIG